MTTATATITLATASIWEITLIYPGCYRGTAIATGTLADVAAWVEATLIPSSRAIGATIGLGRPVHVTGSGCVAGRNSTMAAIGQLCDCGECPAWQLVSPA